MLGRLVARHCCAIVEAGERGLAGVLSGECTQTVGYACGQQPARNVVPGAAREDGGSATACESCLALGGCHDRRLLQPGLPAAGALARPKAGSAILARSPARTQRSRRHALRALRPSSRFAPSFVLCPGPLVATLWMQWRYLARLGDPSGSWTAVTSRPLAQKTPTARLAGSGGFGAVGATLGATRTNDLSPLRTYANSRQ